MEFSVLSSLSFIFITAGLALFVASMLLNWRARQHRERMKNLLALATRDELEPLDLPTAAWPLLAESGWQSMHWQGNWFGHPVAGELGVMSDATPSALRAPPLLLDVDGGAEARLQIRLFHRQRAHGGENRIFAEHLARVFMLLLEARLRARTEALSAALAARARLTLYLQHDMRNLAQWVAWVSTDFAACDTPEALLTTAQRLRDNAPLARERAERLITALGQQPADEIAETLNVRQIVLQAAQMAGFTPEITGEAHAHVARSLLTRALDNLFANLAAAWRTQPATQPRLRLTMNTPVEPQPTGETGQPLCLMEFHCPWPDEHAPLPLTNEKLFEPFASGRPGGLGLGLYQSRKSLREAGGDLLAQTNVHGINFLLKLPAQAHAPTPP